MIVMPGHDILLCDESAQERAVECVDAGAAGAATAAASGLGDVEEVLVGSLSEQTHRCGRSGCRCASGPHGPYLATPIPAGRGRAGMCRTVWWRRCAGGWRSGEQVAAVIAEISAINAELLARRELR